MKSMFDRRQSAQKLRCFTLCHSGLLFDCRLQFESQIETDHVAVPDVFFCISRAAVCCLRCNSFYCTAVCQSIIGDDKLVTAAKYFPMCGIFCDEWLSGMCKRGSILESVELFTMTILGVIIINWDKRLLTRNCGIGLALELLMGAELRCGMKSDCWKRSINISLINVFKL